MTTLPSREEVWKAEAAKHPDGKVFCNLCGGEVLAIEAWDRSHEGHHPRAFGGNVVGVGHVKCNVKNNLEFVIPAAAQARARHKRHVGITGPGLGANALPAGRRSNVVKKVNGEVEPRLTGSQKHARLMTMLHGPGWRGE